ncbi:cob(I)yrinic acid a c-diamide adenosyltransferase [Porphyromonas crevioricanis]|uniref:Corrinoid adenosyltransferase n=1 Tax=Porphyromonas crevioricanis TaxID=393921 RepID=A0A0A2FKW2_9PORP|nr:cob(I)yrinic acid a,c-diamide adenosyltransferase [Porphyromonas crevioricanis]KGN88919.1 cob(I)yrinic acid a c-diamide adenosyltransferase [Porphyromonas crevioricanis]KGN95808.1 cob(I)yrinic acid a c-diamide adenosyltransferase [Porphyromonas crevioricanis]GAD06881.1 cob(I)alamin adenosyltransferase PduO [Porphyromonas crevioricanis JCM 13913]SQH73437.1 Cob(I)yrinic acid a,c-diamide adenosyltransferase [Porphyromonas crevioricanis]
MTKSRIYTGGGDKGTTSLVGGERVPKFDTRLEAYGTIDELNSFIGLLIAEELLPEDYEFLSWIQHKLFTIGSYLATNQDTTSLMVESYVFPKTIERIEKEIDRLDGAMPRMTAFILPAGGRQGALAHVCRTVCRRAERHIYRLISEGAKVEDAVLKFVNRLSDYFFALARKEGYRICGRETTWDKTVL